jgi:phosphatidate cytidylyltransferase
MTRERVLIAIFAFAIFFGIFYFDWRLGTPAGSVLLLTVLGSLALSEFYTLMRRVGLDSSPTLGVTTAAVLFLWRGLGEYTGLGAELVREATFGLLAAAVVLPFVVAIFREGLKASAGREEFERAAVTLLGLLLVWFLLSFLLELRLLDHGGEGPRTTRLGLQLTLILVLSVKVGDSTAYVVGRSFGVTPLTWVSPKKTWEGAAGSVAGGVLVALLLGIPMLDDPFRWWHLLLFGLLTNVAGQLGDLVESLLKRRSGVKDSGTFFREIGGFLDLTDSLLLAAPVGYLLVRLMVL